MKIATIVFTYNRPFHTAKTLAGLQHNSVMPEKLFVFHDGMKNSTEKDEWDKVEEIIRDINWCDSVVITSRSNKGLAKSIIDGLNKVFEEYDAVIVLEDDCVPHRLFMEYMTKALELYEASNNVYSIGASAEPVFVPDNGYDAFFVGRINSCGWGTWRKKWKSFRRDYDLIKEIKKDDDLNNWLQIWGQDLEATLLKNVVGDADTWAAFWALSVIVNKGLSLSPYYSLIENIGYDGTGVHSGVQNIDNQLLKDDNKVFSFPIEANVVDNYEKVFENYYRYTAPVIREKYYKEVLIKWNDYLRNGKDITDWFELNQINRVLIWGIGNVGKIVINALRDKVDIVALIEACPVEDSYSGIPIIKYSEILKANRGEFDCIVLIPGYDKENIARLLNNELQDKLVAIDELFTHVG